MLAEQLVVAVDELGLPHGREQLALIHAVQLAGNPQLAPPGSHGSRGDEDGLYAGLVELGNLVDQRREAGHIERAVATGQHVAAHLHGHAGILLFHVGMLNVQDKHSALPPLQAGRQGGTQRRKIIRQHPAGVF